MMERGARVGGEEKGGEENGGEGKGEEKEKEGVDVKQEEKDTQPLMMVY